jgi:hypothetical protein
VEGIPPGKKIEGLEIKAFFTAWASATTATKFEKPASRVVVLRHGLIPDELAVRS